MSSTLYVSYHSYYNSNIVKFHSYMSRRGQPSPSPTTHTQNFGVHRIFPYNDFKKLYFENFVNLYFENFV